MKSDRYHSRTPEQGLAHVIEECGEVLAAAGKTLRWGPYSYNPEIAESDRELNIDWLRREMADLLHAWSVFEGLVDQARREDASGERPYAANSHA